MYTAMALTVAAMLLGQNQNPLVEESELAPPGQSQVAPPPAPEPQRPPEQAPAPQPQPAPPAIEPAPKPPAAVPAPTEEQGLRRTHERPGGGRPIAAFWFIG